MPSIITTGDASNGLVFTSGNDGEVVIQSGLAGAKVDALSIAADGTPTMIKQPVLPAQSMVRLNTANGYGSTNTAIRRFTTVVTNQGTDITYADSATLGATFTINTSGVYAISRSDQFNAAAGVGLSLNSSQLTTGINAIAVADVLVAASTAASASGVQTAWTGYLTAGAVVRAHDIPGNVTGANTRYGQFTITRAS